MSRTAILFIAIFVVLIGGAIVALGWWSLADKFFPGAARSTGQGLKKGAKPREAEPPVVIRGIPTADSGSSPDSPDDQPRADS